MRQLPHGHLSFKRHMYRRGSRKTRWPMTMLKPQSTGDLSALRSGFAPCVFCHSPLLVAQAATAQLLLDWRSSPSLFGVNEIASRYGCTSHTCCPASARFTELLPCWAPSSVPSGGKAFPILPPWIMLWLLAGSWTPVQTEPISRALPHLARKYLHANTAKWHLTWEPDLL